MAPSADRLLTLPQLAEISEIPYRTLHTWVARGLIRPTWQSSKGSGSPNLFSVNDARHGRVLADLRRAGLGLEGLLRVATELRNHQLAGDEVVSVNGVVRILEENQEIREALVGPEPALVYKVDAAWTHVARALAGGKGALTC